MKKYVFTETQIKKVIDTVITEQSNPVDENVKFGGHEYQVVRIDTGIIKVGKDGILGDNSVLIPWNIVLKLIEKFKD